MALGYNIIRISDYDIFMNLACVIERLEIWIDKYEKIRPEVLEMKGRKSRKKPSPSPLQRGKNYLFVPFKVK